MSLVMKADRSTLNQHTIVRYLFSIAVISTTFGLRIWLIPLTGHGASFVLFFAAVLGISLLAGVGQGSCGPAERASCCLHVCRASRISYRGSSISIVAALPLTGLSSSI